MPLAQISIALVAAVLGQERTAVLPETQPGPTFTLTGRFVGPDKTPAPGIGFAAGVEYAGLLLAHVTAVSDGEGRFAVELPLPAPEFLGDRPRLRTFVQPDAAGFQRRKLLTFVPKDDSEEASTVALRQDFVLQPGFTASLLVVDRAGELDQTREIELQVFEHDPPRWVDGRGLDWSDFRRRPHVQPAGPPGSFLVHASERTSACLPNVRGVGRAGAGRARGIAARRLIRRSPAPL